MTIWMKKKSAGDGPSHDEKVSLAHSQNEKEFKPVHGGLESRHENQSSFDLPTQVGRPEFLSSAGSVLLLMSL